MHANAVQLGVDHAVGLTKGRTARSVPVAAFLLDELSVRCAGKPADALVFSGPNGGYLPRPKSTGGWFAAAVKRAGVQPITPHDLRHTCASPSSFWVRCSSSQPIFSARRAVPTMTHRTHTIDGTPRTARTGLANSREVADYLGTTEAQLARLRWVGTGPTYIRTPGGRTIRYR